MINFFSFTDRRWDEETNYQSTDSYDYNDNNKMSNYGDDGDLGSLMKDDQIKWSRNRNNNNLPYN